MKILYLMANRLKQYYFRNKLLFVLFVLGGALNAISVAYCYGNLVPAVRDRYSTDPAYRDYTVSFANQPAAMEDIARLEESPLIEACTYTSGNRVYCYTDDYPWECLGGTDQLTAPDQALVSHPADQAIGSMGRVEDQKFQVVGLVSNGDGGTVFISKEAFASLGYTENIVRVRIVAAQRQSSKNDAVVRLIQEVFPYHTDIHGRHVMLNATEERLSHQFMGLITINAFLAAVSFAFLLRYLIDSLMGETAVSVIVGATSAKMGTLVLWEAILLSISSAGIGLLLHRIFYAPVFSKLNMTGTITYGAGDYWLMLLLFVVLSVITAVPIMWRYLRVSPVAARKLAQR